MTKEPYSLSVLIPVYNEQESIYYVLEQLTKLDFPFPIDLELITVNDGSSDHTAAEIERFAASYKGDLQIINVLQNKGKGFAIRRGLDVTSKSHVVIQDADLELHPKNLVQIVEKSQASPSCAVFGSRFQKHSTVRGWSDRANILLTGLYNLLSGYQLTDMETCYKLLRTDHMRELQLVENRFGIEPEISMKLARRKIPILEVPVNFHRRTKEEGKKLGWKDGFRAVYCLLKYRLK